MKSLRTILKIQFAVLLSVSLNSCGVIIDTFIFPDKCSCRVVERDFRPNDQGIEEWQDVVHWSGSVLRSKKVAELKKECQEQAALHPFANCECE